MTPFLLSAGGKASQNAVGSGEYTGLAAGPQLPTLAAAEGWRYNGGQPQTQELNMPASDEELHKALRAFKKRLKLTRLDDDSKIGHGPLSGTDKGTVVSIQPPSGFGREIWEQLVEKGFLKRDGIGFYELIPGK